MVGGLDAGEYIPGLATQVQGQLQQFVRAFHRLGLDDLRHSQVELGKVFEVDGVGDGVFSQWGVLGWFLPPRFALCS